MASIAPLRASRPAADQTPLDALLPISPDLRAGVRILVVDDEDSLRETCANVLRREGYEVTVASRGEEALDALRRRPFDIVLVDLYLPQADGFALLDAALTANPSAVVVVMTGNPSVESSIEALRRGAWDYLPKPFAASHLQVLIGRAAHAVLVAKESTAERAAFEREHGHSDRVTLLGASPAFRQVIELARKVAPTDASVLISGESGSGKEVIAQFIHQHSRRSSRPFVAVNCAALPEALLESEMFGHRRGAFTGAVRDKPGLLETANGGTLLLDELVDMSKPTQAKLLRVIQDGVVRRVGSETVDAVVNVRFMAATNSDVEAATRTGALREDLYYRLRVVPIRVPPLRERPEDIPLLAEHFLATSWVRHRAKGAPFPQLAPEAIRALCAHPWRGNVRELQNVIEHAAVLVEPGKVIGPDDMALGGEATGTVAEQTVSPFRVDLFERSYHSARERVLTQFETEYLAWLVNRASGNMSKAARIAGVDRTTLYRMMERHGLQRAPGAGWVVEREAAAADQPDDPPAATPAETGGAS
jgi:DNA-binding NtrC family response regulator